jgi:molecular chaperone DnaK
MLDGILSAPRGVPQIEVSFDIDANGILSVKAKDKGTGKEQKITITASSGLSKEDIDKMQREAEAHASEDVKRKEEVEAKNNADNMAYSAEKMLKDNKDKIPAETQKEIEDKVAAVRTALQGSDIQDINQKAQELSEVMQKAGASVYGQQGEQAAQGGESASTEEPPKKDDEGTVEGEFREV